jgi:hypothetical protein
MQLPTFAVPAKAGSHDSASADFSSDCSALSTYTSSCRGNDGPRHFAGEADWIDREGFLPKLRAPPDLQSIRLNARAGQARRFNDTLRADEQSSRSAKSQSGVGIGRHVDAQIAISSIGMPAGRPAASHSAIALSATLDQYSSSACNNSKSSIGTTAGNRLPIANESHALLSYSARAVASARLSAVPSVRGGSKTTDDIATPI